MLYPHEGSIEHGSSGQSGERLSRIMYIAGHCKHADSLVRGVLNQRSLPCPFPKEKIPEAAQFKRTGWGTAELPHG